MVNKPSPLYSLTFSRGGCSRGRCSGGGGRRCSLNLMTAGYRSRVTVGAGIVPLRAAGEQDTNVSEKLRH